MQKQVAKRLKKYWRKAIKRKNRVKYAVVVLLIIAAGTVSIYFMTKPTHIDPRAYGALLQTIAKGESRGNYNAYFGNANNHEIDFTKMSIAEVLKWQIEYVQAGNPSNAVGKYQIIEPTLKGLVRELQLDTSQKFDEATQDRMAIALLERRGSREYIGQELSRESFAANLAKEWAALPKVVGENPEQSYYAGDGLDKAQIGIPEVFSALDNFKSKAAETIK